MSSTPITLKIVENEVSNHNLKSTEEDTKKCENLILSYAKQLTAEKDAAGIQALLLAVRPFYDMVGKARAGKIIRDVIELSLSIDQGNDEKVAMLKNSIEWSKTNHREFLRRSLEARLIKLYNSIKKYTEAQKLAIRLASELKKLDDKELLIEVSLEESKSSFCLNNFAKSKCALVAAKTTANGTYVSTVLQASIDLQSGVLYSAEERDFKTSYSYFYEAFEGYSTLNDKKNAILALKYMILCKIMVNEAEQIPAMMATKEMANVKGKSIDAIRAMAEAFQKRSLKLFQKALNDYKEELVEDKVVSVHSQNLERNMLEKEISRIIEPYSEIELSFIARSIGMTISPIEKAISKMVLDKTLNGCIDQHSGTVIIYPTASSTKVFTRALTTIKEVTKTVDASYKRANEILN